eukprot:5759285-Pleurochrysis_carterae.AAC.1
MRAKTGCRIAEERRTDQQRRARRECSSIGRGTTAVSGTNGKRPSARTLQHDAAHWRAGASLCVEEPELRRQRGQRAAAESAHLSARRFALARQCALALDRTRDKHAKLQQRAVHVVVRHRPAHAQRARSEGDLVVAVRPTFALAEAVRAQKSASRCGASTNNTHIGSCKVSRKAGAA